MGDDSGVVELHNILKRENRKILLFLFIFPFAATSETRKSIYFDKYVNFKLLKYAEIVAFAPAH